MDKNKYMKMSFGEKARLVKPMLWQVARELTPSPRAGEGFYNCPFCGSGTGIKQTGTFKLILTPNDEHYICFKCRADRRKCTGDTIDLYCKLRGVDKFRAVDELLGIADETKPTVRPNTEAVRKAPVVSARQEKHFTRQHFEKWARVLWNREAERAREYLSFRGISEGIAKRHTIGAVYYYDVWWLIIPTGRYETGLKRCCGNAGNYSPKQKIGRSNLWNVSAIGAGLEPLWVCEGEFDGLSIEEVGGKAVALGGVGQADLAIEAMTEHESKARTILVCLDNDEAGRKTEAYMAERLTKAGFTCYSVGAMLEQYGVKDINELLQKDRGELEQTVRALAC